MIRLIVLMDQNGVVGDTDATKDDAFINLASKQIVTARELLYTSDNVVGEPSSWNKFNPIYNKKKFTIIDNKKFKLFDNKTGISRKIELLTKSYKSSPDELLVVGDLMLF